MSIQRAEGASQERERTWPGMGRGSILETAGAGAKRRADLGSPLAKL